jgi:hypothetical protein
MKIVPWFYRIDVPGEHGQKEVRVALGYCRCEMDAMLRLQKEMEKAESWIWIEFGNDSRYFPHARRMVVGGDNIG